MADDEAQTTDQATESDAPEEASGAGEDASAGGDGVRAKLDSVVGSLNRKEVIIPVAASAASAALAYTVRKGPGLARGAADKMKQTGSDAADEAVSKVADTGTQKAKDALSQASDSGGGIGGMAAGVASKVLGGGGGGKDKGKKTRRLPIQRWTDIAAPADVVYDHWTRYEDFPKFMHRVLSVEQPEENRVTWNEKIWFSKRQWQAEITDDRPNERVAWKTVGGQVDHNGVVTFHRLDDNLTRVLVTIDFRPTGMFEKMASGLRFVKRAVQSDLARFKAFVEMEVEAPEGDGYAQVQDERQEQDDEQGGDQDQQPEARGDDEVQQREAERQDDGQPAADSSAGEEESRAEDAPPAGGAGGEGDVATPEAEGNHDDADREAERRERQARREERRERVSA